MNHSSPVQGNSAERFSYGTWRESFLNTVLRGSSVLGIVALAFYLFSPSSGLFKLLALLTYGICVLVTLLKNLPYSLRASVFVLILYLLALSSLLSLRIADASILFLAFVAMTSLLFSSPEVIASAIGIMMLSILGIGWINSSLAEWMKTTGILLAVATMVATGLYIFQEEFQKTQESAHKIISKLGEDRSLLEQRTEEQSAGLALRTEQLRASSYIARKTAEVQDLAALLDTFAKLITEQFGFYHTGIFLLNETGDQAVLQAASSEGGQRMIERGHALSVGTQGIVGYVAAQRRPRIALDVGTDAVFFNNPDLPMTRSELALPLLIRNRILGVLDIQSDKPQAFSVDDIDLLQTLADQIAIAIENARLIDETQAALVQLEALTSVRTREAWSKKLWERSRVFTYTPLGLRAEKLFKYDDKAVTAPIMLRGQKIGNISIARKGDSTWSKLDRDLIEEVASQVGLAIDNIRLLEEATLRAKQEQTIGKLAARFSQSLDLDTLLQTAARELGQLPDVSEVSVVIGQETEQSPQFKQRSKHTTS